MKHCEDVYMNIELKDTNLELIEAVGDLIQKYKRESITVILYFIIHRINK